MVSNFQRILEKAKQEGEAKLKKVAPKFIVPTKIASDKTKRSRSKGRKISRRVSSAQKEIQAEAKAKEDAQRRRIAQEKLEAEKRIAAAKTFAEKQRIARVYQARVERDVERGRIQANDNIQRQLRAAKLSPIRDSSRNVVGFKSFDTKKTYRYTEAGIAQYNRDIKNVKPTFDFRQAAARAAETRKSRKEDSRLKQIRADFKSDVRKDLNVLQSAARRKEISRLAELQRKKNLTAREKAEKKRLEKKTAANYKRVSDIIYKTMFTSLVDLGYGSVTLAKQLKAEPVATLRSLPRAAWEGLKSDFNRVRSGQGQALIVASEYAAVVGAFKAIPLATKSSLRGLSRLSPKYVRLKNGQWVFRGKPRLNLISQTVTSGAKPLSKQAKLAGQSVTAVNAAADRLTSLIRRGKRIRKPIPGQKKWDDYTVFPRPIATKIKKFDQGKKLTFKELTVVNSWLQKNVAPNITLLERSLYADPAKGFRISRLGITKQKFANLRDILRGNFTLWNKKNRPQVLIFENAKVAKFPKSLSDVQRKLRSGKKLNRAETNRLISWQIRGGTGKFKPIGSTIYQGGRELEITLAPGELIKRIKRVGFAFIDGVKVEFVLAEVFQPTKAILREMKLAHSGKLTKPRLVSLEKNLSKKLGRKIKVETPEIRRLPTSERPNVPVLRVRGRGVAVTSFRSARIASRRKTKRKKITRKRKITKRKKPVRKRPTKRPKRPTPKRPKRPRGKTPKRPAPKRPIRPKRPGKKPPKKPPVVLRLKGYSEKKLSRAVETYYVVTKKRGKFVKLYPKPLKINHARDLAVYSIDNNLSKTALFVPLGKAKKVTTPPKKIAGYYSRARRKVRPYKIKMGKKKKLVNGFIEKRKYFQDTKGEKRQAVRLRRKSVKRKKVVKRRARKKVVKRKPVRRKVVKRRKKVVRRKSPMRKRKKK